MFTITDTVWWPPQCIDIVPKKMMVWQKELIVLALQGMKFMHVFLNSLSCLCSANSGPLDNNRRDCNQWWAILAEMFLTNSWQNVVVRDRPFNLKGGGYGFLFRSENFFQTTQELEYYFFLSRKAWNFFPESNIRLYDKNSESDYFFFPPPKSEYFFQQHWESEYFFRKKP
jgi:hypothetical protein